MKRICFNMRFYRTPADKDGIVKPMRIRYKSKEDLEWAKANAVDGEVTVEEVPDSVRRPTQLDVIEAQVTYTAMMTDTLLEG